MYDESEAESIQVPFGVWSQVVLVKCVLGWAQIPRGRAYFVACPYPLRIIGNLGHR